MTYRVLACLLLGVVRIYSRKVEYLFDDCQDVMVKINEFVVSEKSKKHLETLCAPYYSITLPDRFELDAFDLEILDDVTGDNVMPNEEITLKDGASIAGSFGHNYALAKYHFEEFAACHDICSADYMLTEDIFSPNSMEIDMNVGMPPDLSHLEARMGKLQCNSFSQEQRMDLDISCGIEGEPTGSIGLSDKDHKINEESIKVPAIAESDIGVLGEAIMKKFPDDRFQGVEEEDLDQVKLYGEDHQTDGKQKKVPDSAQLENETCQAISGDNNNSISNLQRSMEKLWDDRFHVVEEPLDPIKLYGEDQQSDAQQMKVPDLVQFENETCQAIGEDNNNNISNLQGSTEKLLDHIVPVLYTNADMLSGSKEPPNQIELSGENQHTDAEEMKSMEISPSGNKKCQFMTGGDPLSVSLDATPQSKLPGASGATTPEFLVVRTPATKEPSRISRKRKCCFDDVIVFPNHVMKQWIQDASDLVSKRKTPCSALSCWRTSQISNLSQGILVPSLPCISSELRSLFFQEKLCFPETVKTVEPLEPEIPTAGRLWDKMTIAPETPTSKSLEKMVIGPDTPTASSDKMVIAPETPTGRSSDQMAIAADTPTGGSSEKLAVAPDTPTGRPSEKMAIAPGTLTGSEQMAVALDTPTGRSSKKMDMPPDAPTVKSSEQVAVSVETPTSHSVSSRPSEILENHKNICSNAGTLAHSYKSKKKDLSLGGDEGFNFIFMNEEPNSCEADDQASDGWSSRTRMVGRYLYERFLYQKKQGEVEAVKLFPILEGKMKKESARFFYEILVLTDKGFVDVKQEDDYGDILIQKAPLWEESCKAVYM